MFSPEALRALCDIDGVRVFMGDPDTGDFVPVVNVKWCSGCNRETIPIGTEEYPRRCPACGFHEQFARAVGDDLDERTL